MKSGRSVTSGSLLGQERAWQKLMEFKENLPQALIFLGPPGVGKQLAAKVLFQFIHCLSPSKNDACGSCASCLKIANGNHPDLLVIKPEGEQIVVDDLRDMKTKLYFKPIEGRLRLVIIDQAHRMNATSANSLLKTLEEPPRHTRFILVTHEKSLLLPTILSRCQTLQFSPLPDETRRAILQRALHERKLTIDSHLEDILLGLLGDGLDRLDQLATEETLEFIKTTSTSLDPLPGAESRTSKWTDIIALADQLSTEDESKLELFLDMLLLSMSQKTKMALAQKNISKTKSMANHALEAAKLRRRLGRYANKRLIAFSSSLNSAVWGEET